MSIRIPTQTVLTAIDTGDLGASSVAGIVSFPFLIPQDTDNVVVKLTASISGGGVSAVFQTSDDGGTTYYDVQRTSIVSNANATTAEWLSVPVISPGVGTLTVPSLIASGSIIAMNTTVGRAGGSTLGSRQVSGLPIMGTANRIALIYSGNITASSLVQAVVKVNSQSKY